MARRKPGPATSMTILDGFDFAALRDLLGKVGADGWLLYDFRGINPTATRVLGIHGMGTRRFFVLLPRTGKPVAAWLRRYMESGGRRRPNICSVSIDVGSAQLIDRERDPAPTVV